MKKISWLCLILLFIIGCKGTDNSKTVPQIHVNPDSSLDFPFEEGQITPLETNDSSLLYDISQIEILDNKYFIWSRDFLLAFNHDGRFLFKVSSRGQSDKEYLSLSSFFVKDNELYLWDSGSYRLLVFNSEGTFLRKISLDKENTDRPIHRLYPYGHDKYISRNSWDGMPGEIPVFTLLDEKFHQISYVEGLNMYEGLSLSAPLYCNNGTIAYWELLNDTIYTIQGTTIHPEYAINFGKYAIPQWVKKGKGVFELAAYVNKPENINKYATNLRYVYEEGHRIYFMFGMKRANYFAVFNKEDSSLKVFGLPETWLKKYRLALFLKEADDKFIFVLEDQENIENNQSLLIIDKKEFLR